MRRGSSHRAYDATKSCQVHTPSAPSSEIFSCQLVGSESIWRNSQWRAAVWAHTATNLPGEFHRANSRISHKLRGLVGSTGKIQQYDAGGIADWSKLGQVAFGDVTPPATCGEPAAIRCAAGSSRHHVERLCLGQPACTVLPDAALFDPAHQLPEHCRGREEGELLGDAINDADSVSGAATFYVQGVCGTV